MTTPFIPDGSVIITPAQMYGEMQAMRTSLEHLTATLDPFTVDVRKDIADHEARIRSIERRLWAQTGASGVLARSEEHTSELQSLMRISYAVFCLNKKNN